MAYAMSALPILGAHAPLAHTAVSCLCVCCAHLASTGLMFRPTGGRWIGFSTISGSLVDDVGVAALVRCLSQKLWHSASFPCELISVEKRALLTFVGCSLPTICGLHVSWLSSVADLTWILIAHRFAVPFKRSTDFYFIAVLSGMMTFILFFYCNDNDFYVSIIFKVTLMHVIGIRGNLKSDILDGQSCVAGVWRGAPLLLWHFSIFFLLAVLLVRDELASPGNMLWIMR